MIPQGLLYHDKDQLAAKMRAFEQAGSAQLQLVVDFDRTLTIGRQGVDGDITTWHILKEHLPDEGKARYQKLFERYRALELAGQMTQPHAVTWWSKILDLYVEYGLSLRDVERDFLHKATIRPYAKELFDLCAKHDIPTIILSAGIKDVIDLWARSYDIRPTVVLSTVLDVDADGRIRGWDESSLIHTLNKKEMGHGHSPIEAIRRQRSSVILIGDGLGDADMAEGEGVLRIRIYDPRPDEQTAVSGVREETFASFDAMIENGSMRSVYDAVMRIVSR